MAVALVFPAELQEGGAVSPLFYRAAGEDQYHSSLGQQLVRDRGYPALMLTDTSFLRNPHYHLPTDTPDTLDYVRMARVTLGVAGALARLAQPAAAQSWCV